MKENSEGYEVRSLMSATASRNESDAAAIVFVSYAREDQPQRQRLAEALESKGAQVCGDWQLVGGEDYVRQLHDLQLKADKLIFLLSPDSVTSPACLDELKFAERQGTPILPVVVRDSQNVPECLQGEGQRPQWIFLRPVDDFNITIEKLWEAIHTNFDLNPERRRVVHATDTWSQHGRSSSYLLRGEGLKRAEEWLIRASERPERLPQPTALQREYIRASQLSRTRNTRYALVAATLIAITLGILAVYAWVKRGEAQSQAKKAEANAQEARNKRDEAEKQARIATSGRLAAIAMLKARENQFDLASLLSIEAVNSADTFEARNALFTMRQYNPRLWGYLHHGSAVHGLAFCCNNQILATASEDGQIRLWNPLTRQLLGKPLRKHRRSVMSVAFNRNETLLASGGADSRVLVWDVMRRKLLWDLKPGDGGTVFSVAFSPAQHLLASGSTQGKVCLWNLASSQPACEPLLGHRKNVFGLAFNPDGTLLASAAEDGVVIWSVATRQCVAEWLREQTLGAASVAFNPNGKLLAVGGFSSVDLWDVPTWTHIESRSCNAQLCSPMQGLVGHNGIVYGLAFSPDLQRMASAGGATIRFWDVLSRPPRAMDEALWGHRDWVNSVAFSSDHKMLASGSSDGTVQLWLVEETPYARSIRERDAWFVRNVWFSPDGHLLGYSSSSDAATAPSKEITIRLLDFRTGNRVHELPGSTLAFSPDHKLLAYGNTYGQLQLWNTTTHQAVGPPMHGRSRPIYSIGFSPDGKTLVSADGSVELWDVKTRLPLGTLGQTKVKCVAFSPGGELASLDLHGNVTFWDVTSRKSLFELPSPDSEPANVLAFTRDGKILATGTSLGSIHLWDLALRKPMGDILASSGRAEVRSIAFSPDGKTLASIGFDSAIRLWDVGSLQMLGAPLNTSTTPQVFGPDGTPTEGSHIKSSEQSLAYSPDGTFLASGDSQGTVRIWDLRWQLRLCEVVNRNLTDSEWRQYVGTATPNQRTCSEVPDGERLSKNR